MESKENKTSWWKTVPGLIASISGLITAVGGLIIVIYTVTKGDDPIDEAQNNGGTSDTTVIIHHAEPTGISSDSLTNTTSGQQGSRDAVPSCLDGVLNGNEKGVDCGGDCPPCNVGYRITVGTSDLKNAGTCEYMYVKLIGEDGSHDFRLNTLLNDFQRNSVDIFDFTTTDLGNLKSFTLEMRDSKNCSGSAYDNLHVGFVTIENLTAKKSTGKIKVNEWMGEHEGFQKLRITKNVKYRTIPIFEINDVKRINNTGSISRN